MNMNTFRVGSNLQYSLMESVLCINMDCRNKKVDLQVGVASGKWQTCHHDNVSISLQYEEREHCWGLKVKFMTVLSATLRHIISVIVRLLLGISDLVESH